MIVTRERISGQYLEQINKQHAYAHYVNLLTRLSQMERRIIEGRWACCDIKKSEIEMYCAIARYSSQLLVIEKLIQKKISPYQVTLSEPSEPTKISTQIAIL